MDWESEQRYSPNGTISRDEATLQIQETSKLVNSLLEYELVEYLRMSEEKLFKEKGPVSLFAVTYGLVPPDGLNLVVSASRNINNDTQKDIIDIISSVVDSDLISLIKGFIFFETTHQLVHLYKMVVLCGNCTILLNNCSVYGTVLPKTYVITCQ